MIVVHIPGAPQPQGRGRAVRTHAGLRVMDPARSRSWKGAAQVHMLEAMRGRPPLEGPVVVGIAAVFACPAGQHRKTPRPASWCAGKKGDWDNIAKAVCDAGNGILWHDDAQVSLGGVIRVVGAQGEAPRVEVAVARILAALPTSRRAESVAVAMLGVFAPEDVRREARA